MKLEVMKKELMRAVIFYPQEFEHMKGHEECVAMVFFFFSKKKAFPEHNCRLHAESQNVGCEPSMPLSVFIRPSPFSFIR